MATRPRALSNKAIAALEDSRVFLFQLREAVRAAQEENIKGNWRQVGIHLGDIREAGVMLEEILGGMRNGNYGDEVPKMYAEWLKRVGQEQAQ